MEGTGGPPCAGWRAQLASTWPVWLLAGALGVYLFTRLFALDAYPIYFFTDEANQTLLAADFLRDGLHNASGEFLPTYFANVYPFNLGPSVYLQVLPALLFERSIAMTRGAPALVSLLAPLWLGLAFKRVYRPSYAWLAALLLSITPAWFLHSRTAFECSLAVTFYAGLLYFYLRYRGGEARAIYPAVVCAALCFYSYSPAQVVVPVSVALFGLADLRYHWRQRGVLLPAAGLGLVCLLPEVRFLLGHPNEIANHLNLLDSVAVQPLPWTEKVASLAGEYLRGLNPLYWYGPDSDLARHTMAGMGNLLTLSLPLGLGGVVLAAWRWRRWEYRTLLLAVLAAPSGAALAGLGITRALFMVAPMALLTALAGAELLEAVARRWRLARPAVSAVAWAVLVAGNIYLLATALVNGPTWSSDYGLAGMQYGARQVFGEVRRYADEHPGAAIVVSPTWANGTDLVARFMLGDPMSVRLESIDYWLVEKKPLDESMLFVLPAEEFERAQRSAKFSLVQVVQTLPYPDGRPGFYFVHLRYVDEIDTIMAEELAARRAMESANVLAGGQLVLVKYSRLDMGAIENVFDGSNESFVRGLAANPLVVQIEFPQPRRMRGIVAQVGGAASVLDVSAEVVGQVQLYQWRWQGRETSVLRTVAMDFEGELMVSKLEIRLSNSQELEPAHVHLWEVAFK
jgi:hypothetical protein